MTSIDLIRHFYDLPRNTAADRGELLAMLTDDIHYVGVGKESAKGRDAIERLFSKYELRGQTNITFRINNIAADGDTVLVDMVDTVTVDGPSADFVFSNVFKVRGDRICYWQEHYDRARFEAILFGTEIPVTETA